MGYGHLGHDIPSSRHEEGMRRRGREASEGCGRGLG